MDNLKKNIRENWKILALIFIVTVAIFLRTYHFHAWLEFRYDQARDARIINDVIEGKSVWPLLGPKMSYTGIKSNNDEAGAFHLGPIYYYFQIISAKIFGGYPDKLAYPDLLFSIISVPLLYYFLKIYFSDNLSLLITAMHAISAYFIRYSRMAWNSNPVSFFALLFILSLYKLLEKNEKTHWMWTVLLGISAGVGFQLHAITMIIFPVVIFFALLYSIRKNFKVWKKWAVVVIIFVVLNTSQILSEIKTNFSNTKSLLNFPVERNIGDASVFALAKNDLVCNIEANFVFLSSHGDGEEKCHSYFSNILSDLQKSNFLGKTSSPLVLLISLFFSMSGYFLLFYYNKKEEDSTKKVFLGLIISYLVIGYLVMVFMSAEKMSYIKYFRFNFFVPYIFLGFLLKFISEKFSKSYVIFAVIIFLMIIFSNGLAISREFSKLIIKGRSCLSRITTLGEIEPIVEYISQNSVNKRIIYFGVDTQTLSAFVDPLEYLLSRKNINSNNVGIEANNLREIKEPVYIFSCKLKKRYLPSYEKINSIYVHQVNREGSGSN